MLLPEYPGGQTCLGESLDEDRLAARHLLLITKVKVESRSSLVSRIVNQQGPLKIWDSLAFFAAD